MALPKLNLLHLPSAVIVCPLGYLILFLVIKKRTRFFKRYANGRLNKQISNQKYIG